MSVRSLAIYILLASTMGSFARAQDQNAPPPERLTLPVLLQLVAERSPKLAVEQVAIDAAKADRITAGALPNPTVNYGHFKPSGGANTLFEGTRQQQATVDFPLLIAGQRGARIEAADQGLLATRARVGLAGDELALHAAELFVGLQAAQEKITVLQDSLNDIKRAAAIVSGRLASGMASRYDLARVEVELAGVTVRMDEARADRANQSAGLAALIGVPGWRPTAIGTPVPAGLPTDATAWRNSLASGNPQINVARREEDAAQAALQRTEHERWPVPVLSLGRTWTSDPFGAANFVGLSTEIPLLDTRRGPLDRAKAELQTAQRRREATESEVSAELLRLLDSLAQRRAALEQFNRNVGAGVPALKQMAEDAYRLGRGSVLELIDAARSRVDVRLTSIDLRTAIVQQELRIKALTGKLGE
jgi:cobalt-zinc-cadmium efflux system outer membrane protein